MILLLKYPTKCTDIAITILCLKHYASNLLLSLRIIFREELYQSIMYKTIIKIKLIYIKLNIKFINAQKAKDVHHYKEIKEILYKARALVCLILIPISYINECCFSPEDDP